MSSCQQSAGWVDAGDRLPSVYRTVNLVVKGLGVVVTGYLDRKGRWRANCQLRPECLDRNSDPIVLFWSDGITLPLPVTAMEAKRLEIETRGCGTGK